MPTTTLQLTRSQKRHIQMFQQATTISENQVRAVVKLLNSGRFSGNNYDQRMAVLEAFNERETPMLITGEQATKGIAWLRNLAFCKNGKGRKNNPFNEAQLRVLQDFSHFTLYDFVEKEVNNYGLMGYYAAYTCHATNGESFTYYATPWQSRKPGGSPLSILANGMAYGPDFVKARAPKVFRNADEVTLPFDIPFVGDSTFPNFEATEFEWFVDSSGFGREDEPALTIDNFLKQLKAFVMESPGYGFGITGSGQFQVYVKAFAPK